MYEMNDERRTKYDLHSAGRKKTWLHISLGVCAYALGTLHRPDPSSSSGW